MGYVFISFSHRDKMFAQVLVEILQANGINVWTELNIHAGESWNNAINNAIRDASIFLVLISGASLQSSALQMEWQQIADTAKPVIPILFRKDKNLPIIFANFQPLTIDSDNVDKLVNEILALLPPDVKTAEKQETKPKSKGYIFISYSLEDIEFVFRLRKFFAQKGYAYWDYQETSRKYDMPFHLEIEEAIGGASAIVSVVSPAWKASKWATREYLFSEQVGKTNFICISREVGATLLYADKTFIEFFADEGNGFDLLDKALRREGLID